jgi:hypothetical protein
MWIIMVDSDRPQIMWNIIVDSDRPQIMWNIIVDSDRGYRHTLRMCNNYFSPWKNWLRESVPLLHLFWHWLFSYCCITGSYHQYKTVNVRHRDAPADCRYSDTNVKHILFNLLRIRASTCFEQKLLILRRRYTKRHFVYCVRVMSVSCYQGGSGTDAR